MRTLVAIVTYSFHWLIMEKWKLSFIAVSLQIFWKKCYRNVPWEVLYVKSQFCLNSWIWFVAMTTKTLNLKKKNNKKISLEALWRTKLKLSWNVPSVTMWLQGHLDQWRTRAPQGGILKKKKNAARKIFVKLKPVSFGFYFVFQGRQLRRVFKNKVQKELCL